MGGRLGVGKSVLLRVFGRGGKLEKDKSEDGFLWRLGSVWHNLAHEARVYRGLKIICTYLGGFLVDFAGVFGGFACVLAYRRILRPKASGDPGTPQNTQPSIHTALR